MVNRIIIADAMGSPRTTSGYACALLFCSTVAAVALPRELWRIPVDGGIRAAPTVAKDGTVYVGTAHLHPDAHGNNLRYGKLYSISPEGKKWVFPRPSNSAAFLRSTPAIGSDGTIYIGNDDGQLYAINPDGTLGWTAATGRFGFDASPAIGPSSICFAPFRGLYSVSLSGQSNWSFNPSPYDIQDSTPAFAANGKVYWGKVPALFEVQPDGTPQPLLEHSINNYISTSPTISPDGVLYVASWNGDINDYYSDWYGPPGLLHAYQLDSGPAESPWPMYRGNAQHTGRAFQASLRISRETGGSIGLSFTVESVANYSLEISPDLKTWSEVIRLTAPAPAPHLTYPSTFDRLFYRLRVFTNVSAIVGESL